MVFLLNVFHKLLPADQAGSASVIENSTVQGKEDAIGPKSNRKAFRASLFCPGT